MAATPSGARCARVSRRGTCRPPRLSKLDPFREEIHRLLRDDPRLPGKRISELLEEQSYAGGKTIVDDYLREVRPLFCRGRALSSAPPTGRGRLPVRPVDAEP
jgi:hypothetical protein